MLIYQFVIFVHFFVYIEYHISKQQREVITFNL